MGGGMKTIGNMSALDVRSTSRMKFRGFLTQSMECRTTAPTAVQRWMVMEMAKYADIEPFYDWLTELIRLDTSDYPDHNTLMFYEILDELDSLTEVVRCKDCKNWMYEYDDVGLCVTDVPDVDGVQRHACDFCSYGERKDNDN